MKTKSKKNLNGRLVLTRKIHQTIMIDDNIEIMIAAIESDRVKIAIKAPSHITVHRREIYDKILQEKHEIRSVNRVVRQTKKRFLSLPRNVLRLGDRS